MDFLPDVLDHLGKTPREFGGLHAHFESVLTIDGTRVAARMLYQAAFQPLPPGAQIAFHAAIGESAQGEQLGCFDVPALADEVVRVSYPLRVPAASTHVLAFLRAPPPARRAERVRPAWLLTDTLEVPKLSEMEPVRGPEGLDLGRSLLGTALMGGAGFMIAFNSGPVIPANTKTTLHKARELPPGLVQAISIEVTAPIDSVVEEVLWRSGQPLPPAPQLVFTPAPQAKTGATRWCRSCGFEGPAAEYERARSCPNCDEPWL